MDINNTDRYDLHQISHKYSEVDDYFNKEMNKISYPIYNKDNIDLSNMENGTIFDYYSDDWFYAIKNILIDHRYISVSNILPPGVYRLGKNSDKIYIVSDNKLSNAKPEDVKKGITFNSVYGRDLIGTMENDDYYIGMVPKDLIDIQKKQIMLKILL